MEIFIKRHGEEENPAGKVFCGNCGSGNMRLATVILSKCGCCGRKKMRSRRIEAAWGK